MDLIVSLYEVTTNYGLVLHYTWIPLSLDSFKDVQNHIEAVTYCFNVEYASDTDPVS